MAKKKEEKTEPKERRVVEVICDGALGSQLLKTGDITDAEEYTDLLDSTYGLTLVREIIEVVAEEPAATTDETDETETAK